MEADRFFCVHEDEVEGFSVARQGSTAQVKIRRLFDPEASGSQAAIVIIADVPPNQPESMPPHFHREFEETMYVASGHGNIEVGSSPDDLRSIPIRPGSCCLVPADYFHRIQVLGDEPVKLICAYFNSAAGKGKSHREISVELTSLPLQWGYGTRKA